MDLSKEEVAKLQAEAEAIRVRFKALGKALRSEPANAEYLRERLKIQNRYGEIARILGAAQVKVTASDELDVDLLRARERARASGRRPVWQPVESERELTTSSSTSEAAPTVSRARRFKLGRTVLIARLVVAGVLLMVLGSVLLLIYTGRLSFYVVPSDSMLPTLRPNDQLLVTRDDDYRPGQIVVLTDPIDPESFVVKRIVGVSGDLLEVRNRTLYRNGVAVDEPYLREAMDFRMQPFRVPEDAVFIAGDNRNESDDSFRSRKAVPASSIRGRVRYIYLPNERRGPVPAN